MTVPFRAVPSVPAWMCGCKASQHILEVISPVWVGEGLVLEEGLRGIGDGHLPLPLAGEGRPNSGFLRSPSGLKSGLRAGPMPAQPMSTDWTLQGLRGMSLLVYPAWISDSPRTSVTCAAGAMTPYRALVLIWKIAIVLRWTWDHVQGMAWNCRLWAWKNYHSLGDLDPVSIWHPHMLPESGLYCPPNAV